MKNKTKRKLEIIKKPKTVQLMKPTATKTCLTKRKHAILVLAATRKPLFTEKNVSP